MCENPGMGIGKDVQRELDRRTWTAYRLSQEAGMEYKTVDSIIRNDSNPRIDTVLMIARGFGITIDELVEHPKPEARIRAGPPTIKEVREVLRSLGIDEDCIDIIINIIRERLKQLKDHGDNTAATG